MNADQIGGIVRAILAAVAGYFVGKGVVDQGTATTIVGAIGTLVVAVWSVVTNRSGKVIPPKT